MKRRSFLQGLLALAAAPVVAKTVTPEPAFHPVKLDPAGRIPMSEPPSWNSELVASKTPEQILEDIRSWALKTWEESGYENHFKIAERPTGEGWDNPCKVTKEQVGLGRGFTKYSTPIDDAVYQVSSDHRKMDETLVPNKQRVPGIRLDTRFYYQPYAVPLKPPASA